jgi:Bacterial regulatory proteins, tetR family
MPCREADFGSRAALRNLRRSLVGALAGRARVAEPCAARQAGLGDVPTLRGPWRLQVFARLTRASAPLKRRSRRPGGRRPSQGRCSFALRFTPKRREDPQIERILHATVEVIADEGYGAATVADVVRAAGISRETFYTHFADSATHYLAAFRQGFEQTLAAALGAFFSAAGGRCERVGESGRAFTDLLASERGLRTSASTMPTSGSGFSWRMDIAIAPMPPGFPELPPRRSRRCD